MPFKLISRPDPAPMEFLVTNGTALRYGQCVSFTSGRLVAATAAGVVAGVALHDVAAGTDKTCRIILVCPEQVWEADYIGTPNVGFIVGVTTATIDTGVSGGVGANLDSANITSGPCSVLRIDPGPRKALVKFRNRQLS